MSKQSGFQWLRFVLYGMCMGAADLVPGVSGGTMALVCGIYEKLIHAINSLGSLDAVSIFWLDVKRFHKTVPWKFLLSLCLGIALAFVVFSQMIHAMLGNPSGRINLYAFFLGMVTTSIIICLKKIPKWNKQLYWGLAIGGGLSFVITGYQTEPLNKDRLYNVVLPADSQYRGNKEIINYQQEKGILTNVDRAALAVMWEKGFVKSDTIVISLENGQRYKVSNIVVKREYPKLDPWLIFCGAMASAAMLLPGISGSFLLIILGAYPTVLSALADLVKSWIALSWDSDAFFILGNLGIGIALGALLFSRIVDRQLTRNHDLTMSVLVGFMIGSIRVIWPYWHFGWELDPVRLNRGPQLVPLEAYYPYGWWDVQYLYSVIYWGAGFLLVLFLHLLPQNAKR